jgi:hypothetical protein
MSGGQPDTLLFFANRSMTREATMSYVIAAPDMLAASAADVACIGSSLSEL